VSYLKFEQLQARLIYLKSRMKWKEILLLPDFRGVAAGTLSNALHGREPRDPIIRAKLHLAPDKNCGHCWRFNKYIKEATRSPSRWADMPLETLRVAFEFREEVK